MELIWPRVRVHELSRRDRMESLGPHIGEGAFSQWDGAAHEASVGDGLMVSRGPEDGVAG